MPDIKRGKLNRSIFSDPGQTAYDSVNKKIPFIKVLIKIAYFRYKNDIEVIKVELSVLVNHITQLT